MSATLIDAPPAPNTAEQANPLETALSLARRGFHIFPLAAGCKTPRKGSHGYEDATDDPAQIRAWFTGGNANVAIRCDSVGGRPIFALDVDGPEGAANLAYLEDKNGALPQTLTNITRRGKHLIFHALEPVGISASKVASHLDVRGHDGYVVAPGSDVGGHRYHFEDPGADIAEAPEWLFQMARADGSETVTRPIDRTPLPGIDPGRASARGLEYLKTAPLAVEGEAGDTTTYRVAARLKDFGCGMWAAFELMADHWNPRCSPPWDESELAQKVDHAFRYGREPQGIAAPEAVFEPAEVEDDEPLHPLDRLNKEYAFILNGGGKPILHETQDAEGKHCVDFLRLDNFLAWFKNSPVQFGNKMKPLGQAWMEWKKRRQYSRVVFLPGEEAPADAFNLWSGFDVQPQVGSWNLMRRHILDVLCDGDPDLGEYFLNWLALMFQRPATRAGTALVLRGDKGTGKGTLGDWLLRIVGRHGVHIANSRHLTGNFNSHLREAIFLFGDESFFAGDRSHESVLKALVTERELVIEPKGVDVMIQRNCLHVLLASNSDWVVPASANERRFCVCDVSSAHMGDFRYFDALEKERDGGGLEAMLFELLARDLSGFNVWKIPMTRGLLDQKMDTLRGAERWLADVLAEGAIADGGLGRFEWQTSGLPILRSSAYATYERLARGRYREVVPMAPSPFWRKIRAIIPGIGEARPGRSGSRERSVLFPPLDECRAAFEAHMKGKIDWQ